MKRITIAIDGYSSTGKSTVAKELADYLNYVYVDSGAMYRAITLFALQKGFISESHFNKIALINSLEDISIEFRNDDTISVVEMYLNDKNVEREIRTFQVSEYVSQVAALSEVRKKLVTIQHQMGKNKAIVMDGRDIGTVVFPEAELKIFMSAKPEERASRRYKELIEKGDDITYEEIYKNVQERDLMDTTRKDSPLIKAVDAIEIDNSELNLEDQFHIILQLAKDRIVGRV